MACTLNDNLYVVEWICEGAQILSSRYIGLANEWKPLNQDTKIFYYSFGFDKFIKCQSFFFQYKIIYSKKSAYIQQMGRLNFII